MNLPPPDPNEVAGDAPGLELAEPTLGFPDGPPTPEEQQLAKRILEHRPGALLVFSTR